MTEGCPGCGGPTEYDREVPPNPYFCSDECESNPMTDYYKHIYSQRDVDLIRGDLMRRIAELTDSIDAFNHIDRSGRHDTADLEQLNDAIERCLRLIDA